MNLFSSSNFLSIVYCIYYACMTATAYNHKPLSFNVSYECLVVLNQRVMNKPLSFYLRILRWKTLLVTCFSWNLTTNNKIWTIILFSFRKPLWSFILLHNYTVLLKSRLIQDRIDQLSPIREDIPAL